MNYDMNCTMRSVQKNYVIKSPSTITKKKKKTIFIVNKMNFLFL